MIGRGRERDPLSDDLSALDDLQDEASRPIRRPTSLIVPILITMIVMTGGVTIAWYSYNAGVKEGSEGAAPLLKPDGPMKVAPKNPGGTQIPHKDISVYQPLTEGKEERKVERILPPPEQPLTPPSAPPTAAAPQNAAPGNADPRNASPGDTAPVDNSRVRSADTVPGQTPPAEPSAPETPSARSLIPPSSAPDSPKSPKSPAESPQIAMKAPTEKTAPAPAKPAEKEVRTAPVKPAPAPEPKVASIPPGAYKVQIGSVSSEEQAGRLWKIQSGKSGGLLTKLSMNVEKKVINGKAYYRIQAGPLKDAASARKLCADLKSRGVGCFVVYPK